MNIKVFIAAKQPKEYPSDSDINLYILPSANTWNDFGYSLMVELVVVKGDRKVHVRRGVKAYFGSELNSSGYLMGVPSPIELSSPGSPLPFATFLGAKENYLEILSIAPLSEVRELLLRMNEISALRAWKRSSLEYGDIIKSEPVQTSFLRTSEAYLTFIGLEKILSEFQSGAAKKNELFELNFFETISTDGSLLTLPLHPDLLGANPIHGIIGRNGLGKTRLLKDLAATLSGEKPDDMALHNEQWIDELLLRQGLPRVVVFTHDMARWSTPATGNIKIRPLNVYGPAWIDLGQKLFDLARSASANTSDFSWSALRRIVKGHVPIEQMHFPRNDGTYFHHSQILDTFGKAEAKLASEFDASRPIAFFDESNNRYELSSGQKVILSFLAQLFHEAHDYTVYLFDEPEVHLHPQFISLVMMTLYDALMATRSIAVLATHSPYVIRELNKECVTVLVPNKSDGVAFARPTLQTRGASISAISEYVFEHSREASLTRARLQAFVMRESVGVPESLIRDLAGLVGSEGLNEVPEILAEGKGA